MITQEKFDSAYNRIAEMGRKTLEERMVLKGNIERLAEYQGLHSCELALSQVLSILRDAEAGR